MGGYCVNDKDFVLLTFLVLSEPFTINNYFSMRSGEVTCWTVHVTCNIGG